MSIGTGLAGCNNGSSTNKPPPPGPVQMCGQLTKTAVEQRVKTIVAEQMEPSKSEFTMQSSFFDDLKLDSLDFVELLMKLEDAFELSIPDGEAEKMQTPALAVDYVCLSLNENAR